ncbi:unnamed protein product [Mytilus coruscus]|uniref:Uncharacterized protein n=1 Tax=Mytilus coruscus TaxID=42192 RepID=A0A6J8D7A1_MYTCO|nr:unnamed protein product [Mytilus coruscus]
MIVFFYGESSGELHKVATFGIDSNVKKYALEVQDTVLLAKLSAGDMISQEAMYHKRCNSNLFNYKERLQKIGDAKEDNQFHGIVLAELVAYIEDSRMDTELYVSCQVRNGDLVEFFRHENQAYPPSLSQFGELRHGSKSDLLVQLERITDSVNEAPTVDALVIDGAALINMLKPRGSKTCEGYYKDIVVPYIRGQLLSVRRIDMVWDEYIQDSFKASERSRRGKGIRRRVLPDSKVPGNWEAFLRVDENKKELFAFISEQLVSRDIVFDEEKQIVSTTGSNVNCRKEEDVSKIAPCTQEEANTRMMLHVNAAVADRHKCVMIRIVDTDVVVIAISVLQKIESILELWIAFGVGKNFRYLSIHDIANALGPEKSHGLLFFHAFTGCDQVSSFANKGKKSAWNTWTSYEEITGTFDLLSNEESSSNVLFDHMGDIEHFVILMYDKTS